MLDAIGTPKTDLISHPRQPYKASADELSLKDLPVGVTRFVLCFFCLFLSNQQGVQQKRPSEAQNAILRRYFLELTQSFIIPLVGSIPMTFCNLFKCSLARHVAVMGILTHVVSDRSATSLA